MSDNISDHEATQEDPEPPEEEPSGRPSIFNLPMSSSDEGGSDSSDGSSVSTIDMEEMNMRLRRGILPDESDNDEGSGEEEVDRVNVRNAEIVKILERSFPSNNEVPDQVPKMIRARRQKRRSDGEFKQCVYLEAAYKFSDQCQTEFTGHTGCVNALGWSSGGLLVSGSDDKFINIYNPYGKSTKPLYRFKTGHRSNIFQCKYVPFCNNSLIVTCARDGLVRLAKLDAGGCPITLSDDEPTKVVARHEQSAHKLCFIPQTSNILSAGEDGKVIRIDPRVRPEDNEELFKVKSARGALETLYAIDHSPFQPQFAICGDFNFALIYDSRNVLEPVHITAHEQSKNNSITCLKYNYAGTELLCSYNDDEIYRMSLDSQILQRFSGHRNRQTIKGVNYYGPRSEFIISGSDCGHFYIWDSQTGALVNSQIADGNDDCPGVVNVLEPNNANPILATSGLDNEVKIWTPSAQTFLKDEERVNQTTQRIKSNITARLRSGRGGTDRITLLRQLARFLPSRILENLYNGESDDDDSDEDRDDDHVAEDRNECRQM